MFNRKIIIIILGFILIVVLGVLVIFYKNGYMSIRDNGMSAIAYNAELFTDKDSRILYGDYSISINLSDLDSNLGKVLYDDGMNIIEIDNIRESGNYIICFKTYGSYDFNRATLISAIKHNTSDGNVYDVEYISRIAALYKGEKTSCKMRSVSGLNYKDGADFEVYIFPSDEYANENIHNKDYGIVEITFTDLYLNKWKRR